MEPIEMRKHRLPLDDDTIDRLLSGRLDEQDAPPGYADLTSLLAAAARTAPATSIDDELMEAMVQAINASPNPSNDRKPSMISKLLTAKVGAAAAALVVSTTGAAAAATGNLPAPAQDALAKAAERVGFELPVSDDADPTTDEVPGDEAVPAEDEVPADEEAPDPDDGTTGNVDNPTDADQHGVDVSGVARDPELTGREKGQAVSDVARNGHGPGATTTTVADDGVDGSLDDRGRPADAGSQAPVTTPSGGGIGVAGDASGGRSDAGTSRAPAQAGARADTADR